MISWKNERPLWTAEFLAILEEDVDLLPTNTVDAVYITSPIDEITDEELNDDIYENEINLSEFIGTYEIHASLPDTFKTDNQLVLLSSKIASISKKL